MGFLFLHQTPVWKSASEEQSLTEHDSGQCQALAVRPWTLYRYSSSLQKHWEGYSIGHRNK